MAIGDSFLTSGGAGREPAAPSAGLRRGIATVAYGGPYARGAQRLFDSVVAFGPCCAWRRFPETYTVPIIVNGWDCTGYWLKPLALASMAQYTDLVLLLDASVVAIAPLDPLWAHIEKQGYYLGESGFTCGQWTSDEMLDACKVTRDAAMALPQPASGIVGLDMREPASRALVNDWCNLRRFFPGPHSNINAETKAYSYRNEGWVSDDPRCLGHRHDQAALGLIAHQLGLLDFQPWTKPGLDAGFVAYGRSGVSERTVLVVEGVHGL
jgi:hypothetical protein